MAGCFSFVLFCEVVRPCRLCVDSLVGARYSLVQVCGDDSRVSKYT